MSRSNRVGPCVAAESPVMFAKQTSSSSQSAKRPKSLPRGNRRKTSTDSTSPKITEFFSVRRSNRRTGKQIEDDTIKSVTPTSKSYRLLAELPVKTTAQKKEKSLEIETEIEVVQERNHNKLPDANIDLPEKIEQSASPQKQLTKSPSKVKRVSPEKQKEETPSAATDLLEKNDQVALPRQKELEKSPAKMPRLTPEKSENDQELSNSKTKAKVNLIEKYNQLTSPQKQLNTNPSTIPTISPEKKKEGSLSLGAVGNLLEKVKQVDSPRQLLDKIPSKAQEILPEKKAVEIGGSKAKANLLERIRAKETVKREAARLRDPVLEKKRNHLLMLNDRMLRCITMLYAVKKARSMAVADVVEKLVFSSSTILAKDDIHAQLRLLCDVAPSFFKQTKLMGRDYLQLTENCIEKIQHIINEEITRISNDIDEKARRALENSRAVS